MVDTMKMNIKAMEHMMDPILLMLEEAIPDTKPTCKLCRLLEDAVYLVIGETKITQLIIQMIISECERNPEAMRDKLQQMNIKILAILVATQGEESEMQEENEWIEENAGIGEEL